MQLLCKTCGAPLKAENTNLDTCIAACDYCNALTYFGDTMSPARTSAGEYRDRYWTEEKDAIGPHARFAVEEQGNQLMIAYRWFTWGILFLVFFCIIWDGFLVMWYSIGLTQDAPWMMLVFPLLHVAVGVALTYFTICCLINSTEIRVTGDEIAVTHGPLPCVKNQHLPVEQLSQLYCQEEIKRGKDSTSYKYNVMAKLTDGGKKKLLTGFDDCEQAVYLERLIEKHLNLEDQHVSGEHRL